MKKLILLLFLFTAFTSIHAQTKYYVDGDKGNDSKDGTSETIAWKTIQHACEKAIPNSIVYIKGGIYYENLDMQVSGKIGNPITFKNFNDAEVIIDGTGTSGSEMLNIADKSYLNFENLTIQNLTGNNSVGVYIECSPSGTVKSLSFKGIIIRNINWINNAGKIPGDNDNAQPFIAYGRGTSSSNSFSDLVIEGCEIYNNILGYSEALSIDGNIDGFVVRKNYVHNNTNIGIYAGGNYGECENPDLDHARNGIIENNITHNNISDYATSGGIYLDGSKDVIVRNNITYSNGYGIEIGSEEDGETENITVINNLVYNNDICGISVGGYTTETTGQVLNCLIRNNSLFANDVSKNGSGEFYLTKASNCTFINNTIYTNDQDILMALENISPQENNVFDYNCWFTPDNNPNNAQVGWRAGYYESFSEYKKETSQDQHSIYKNPMFASTDLNNIDLKPLDGSPCFNAGDPETIVPKSETDFSGNSRISNDTIDIGAYEVEMSPGIIIQDLDESEIMTLTIEEEILQIYSPFGPSMNMSIFDVNGRLVENRIVNSPTSNINISHIPKGIYFVRLSSGELIKTVTIMKQ